MGKPTDHYQKGRADAAEGKSQKLPRDTWGDFFLGDNGPGKDRDQYREGYADKRREIEREKK